MTTVTVDGATGEIVDIDGDLPDEPRALVVRDQGMDATGALAIGGLTDDDFARRLEALKTGQKRIAEIQRALMTADVDFGVIPGTKKPTLLKPGAEKLCIAYSLAADFTPRRTIGDGETAPHLSYLTRCELHRGSVEGPVVAVGYGASNSWETRYRYRNAERVCPNCGKPAVIKGSAQYGGGWLCWRKKDGCGSKWPDGAPEIEGQSVGQTENPDPFDLDVTLAKMAEKRAHVDATLRATGASSLFTQDMEDAPADDSPPPPKGEVEELIGINAGVGTIQVGGAATTKLEVRETPEGPAFGFYLKAPKGEGDNMPQVIVKGDLAAAIIIAEGGDPAKLKGHWCRVRGRVVSVREEGRAGFFRMYPTEFETRDYKLPASEPTVAATLSEDSGPLVHVGSPNLSDADEAELDGALVLPLGQS